MKDGYKRDGDPAAGRKECGSKGVLYGGSQSASAVRLLLPWHRNVPGMADDAMKTWGGWDWWNLQHFNPQMHAESDQSEEKCC